MWMAANCSPFDSRAELIFRNAGCLRALHPVWTSFSVERRMFFQRVIYLRQLFWDRFAQKIPGCLLTRSQMSVKGLEAAVHALL